VDKLAISCSSNVTSLTFSRMKSLGDKADQIAPAKVTTDVTAKVQSTVRPRPTALESLLACDGFAFCGRRGRSPIGPRHAAAVFGFTKSADARSYTAP
jgi:hypothetical protein